MNIHNVYLRFVMPDKSEKLVPVADVISVGPPVDEETGEESTLADSNLYNEEGFRYVNPSLTIQ